MQAALAVQNENDHSKEKFKMKGHLSLVVHGPDGKVKERREFDNLITNVGFDFICAALGDSGRGAIMGYIGVGTDATAAAAGNTALGTESARVAATYAHTGSTKIFTLAATFNAGTATAALTEAAVFNAASVGTMLNRVVFSTVNKGALDTLTVTFTFTLS